MALIHITASLFLVTMGLGSESQEDEPAQKKTYDRREETPRPRMLT
jgi:hypothetical protein